MNRPLLLAVALCLVSTAAAAARHEVGPGSAQERVGQSTVAHAAEAHRGPLPRPTGPHALGVRRLFWSDVDRAEPCTEDPDDRREVGAEVWYPARPVPAADPAPYIPNVTALTAGLRDGHGRRGAWLARWLPKIADAPTHSVSNAPFADLPAPAPLLLLSPGGNMSPHFYTGLAEELASHGHVVAVLVHPHSSLVCTPRGDVSLSHPRWSPPADAAQDERDAHFEPLAERLAADASFVLDRLTSLGADDSGDAFAGHLDLTRVGCVGHSRGGKTVARLDRSDVRVRASAVLDNLPPRAKRERGFRTPLLVLRADGWTDADDDGLGDLGGRETPFYDAVLAGADHMSFSDSPLLDARRFDPELEPVHGLRLTARCLRAFFARHLETDAQPLEPGDWPRDAALRWRQHDREEGSEPRPVARGFADQRSSATSRPSESTTHGQRDTTGVRATAGGIASDELPAPELRRPLR